MTQVLIVDDSTVSRIMVQQIMEANHPEWELHLAANSDEAIELTREMDTLDVAILDYNMPGRNGIDLGIQLQDEMGCKHIALLTANIQDSIKNKAKTAGFHFINKPIEESLITQFTKAI